MQESETDYVNRELNLWKVDMYSKNQHLYTLPKSRIESQKELLIKQYRQNYKYSDSLKPLRDYYGISKELVDKNEYHNPYCNVYLYIGIFCFMFSVSLWIFKLW